MPLREQDPNSTPIFSDPQPPVFEGFTLEAKQAIARGVQLAQDLHQHFDTGFLLLGLSYTTRARAYLERMGITSERIAEKLANSKIDDTPNVLGFSQALDEQDTLLVVLGCASNLNPNGSNPTNELHILAEIAKFSGRGHDVMRDLGRRSSGAAPLDLYSVLKLSFSAEIV